MAPRDHDSAADPASDDPFDGWRDAGVDPTKPNIARVYDYWLGGRHNLVADRELAEAMATLDPWIPAACKANRAFLGRAVRHLAAHGIRQFLDIGSGIPTAGNVHQIAQCAAAGSRVVYVDRDPVAVIMGPQAARPVCHRPDGPDGRAVLAEGRSPSIWIPPTWRSAAAESGLWPKPSSLTHRNIYRGMAQFTVLFAESGQADGSVTSDRYSFTARFAWSARSCSRTTTFCCLGESSVSFNSPTNKLTASRMLLSW